MTSDTPVRILLGPQTPQRNIAEAMQNAALPDGQLAVISAGWQEAEGDIGELAELVGRPLEDLGLYARAEAALAADERLADAARQRQHQLVDQQRLYRLRLKHLSIAARHTLGADGEADMVAAEQRHAVAQLRALDRHHLHRCESIWRSFEETTSVDGNSHLAAHARDIKEVIQRSAGLIITGGNVAILVNRMRLFGVDRMLDDCHILAWSAGAMALTERIVLFHERAPEGRRDAEVFGAGCGVLPGFVFLPDVKHRLRTSDRKRVGLMSRRFSPDACIALDNGAELRLEGSGVAFAENVRQLNHSGRLTSVRPT